MKQDARIQGLDGLRAISISFVLLAHLAGTRFFCLPTEIGGFSWPFHFGMFGVRVFFVISGFLITGLLMAERRESGTVSLARFYLRRTLRIFPAYYLFVAVASLLAFVGAVQLKDGDLLSALTYSMNYHHERGWVLGHSWSLAVEEQFYLLWPALFSWLGEGRSKKLLAAYICMAPAWRMTIALYIPNWMNGIGESFFTTADALACGCLLALWRNELAASEWYRRLVKSKLTWGIVPPLVVLMLLGSSAKFRWAIGSSGQNVLVALAIERVMASNTGFIHGIMNCRPVVTLGLWSYSVYLWQQLFLNRAAQESWLTSFPANLALCISVAAMSYYLVEQPFLRWRRQLERRRFVPAPAHP